MSETFEDHSFLTTDEAAEYLRVSQFTVWRWCHQGRLPAFQINRIWRIRKEKLDEFIEELETVDNQEKLEAGDNEDGAADNQDDQDTPQVPPLQEQPTTSTFKRELRLLEEIQRTPDTTQADLGDRLGVSGASINKYIKRVVEKGYVKVQPAQGLRVRYLITPAGISAKEKLAASYVETAMRLYRHTRDAAQAYLAQVREAGYERVRVSGDGDLADVCRLTCGEQGVEVADVGKDLPVLGVDGRELTLAWPETTESE